LKRGELWAWEFSKESEAIVGVERILEVRGIDYFHQLAITSSFQLRVRSDYYELWLSVIFDDVIRALNSCETMGMLNLMELYVCVLKLIVVVGDKVCWWILLNWM
jgi:hypothetical protein